MTTRHRRPRARERGAAIAATLVVIFALTAVVALAALSGQTNLLVATNLKAATQARENAETNVHEAIYRLSRPDTDPDAIVPVLTNPDWRVGIYFTTGDTNPSDQ